MNIHVEILEDVVKVYSDSDFLFHFKVSRWDRIKHEEEICTSCNMLGLCRWPIMFGTRHKFRESICQKLGPELKPEISGEEDARKLISSIRGKIIKKNLRK